jgi:hypothetical protein
VQAGPVDTGRPAPFHDQTGSDRYDVQQVGGATILEYWIPAEDLDELNANIVGTIDVVAEYR